MADGDVTPTPAKPAEESVQDLEAKLLAKAEQKIKTTFDVTKIKLPDHIVTIVILVMALIIVVMGFGLYLTWSSNAELMKDVRDVQSAAADLSINQDLMKKNIDTISTQSTSLTTNLQSLKDKVEGRKTQTQTTIGSQAGSIGFQAKPIPSASPSPSPKK